MKIKILLFSLLICNICTSQSISKTKLYELLLSQDEKAIITYLTNRNFKSIGPDLIANGLTIKQFGKVELDNKEGFGFGKNDELFMISYMPAHKYFSAYVELLKTSDFRYEYTVGDIVHYENGEVRLGINPKGFVSLFIDLKK